MTLEIPSMYRLQVVGSTAIVQPVRHTQAVGDSLVVDLRKGSLGTATYPLMHSDYITLLAILGVYRLRNRTVVAAVTAAQQVATIGASAVFVVKGTQLFGPADADTDTDDAKLTELLQGALDPVGTGANLYFSYDRNLTNRRQREASLRAASAASQAAGPPSHQQSDARFFWNHFLSQPLIDAGAHQFVMPVVQGFVEQLEIAGPPGGSGRSRKAVVTLLARRDVGRVGTRHWRRGADREGHVANFVETEQLVEFDDGSAASFVQTRGSIPILWSQVPNIKYKPPTLISDAAKYRPAFFKHAKAMTEAYTGLVGVNLVNTHGSEAKLAAAYEQEVAHAKATLSDVELVGFDFHKECGAANYANLSKLWQQLEPHFQRFGFFMQEGEEVVLRQSGVFRVNCVDCLDRTNVVQGLLARKALEALLRRVGFMQPHDDLPSAFPETEAGFKNLWADHGDAVSLHYAGTGALKSGFTRTGKRSVDGLIDDGIKSCLRYYLNNFEDGNKQDSLDLLMGGYQVSASKSSPFQDKQPSCVLLLLVALLCALLGVAQLWRAAVQASTFSALMALPLWLAAVQVINTVLRQGPRFTCRPQLRPDLTQPW